jgi:hypothetical protein
MSHSHGKNHLGDLPSPVTGMNLGHWLGRARMTEDKLVAFLAWPDLEPAQRAKVEKLLGQIRSNIVEQLARVN